MTRGDYIKYRVENNATTILYFYTREMGLTTVLNLEQFTYVLNEWIDFIFRGHLEQETPISKQEIFNRIARMAIEHYDAKFEVVQIIYEKENKTKRKFVIMM